MTQDFSGKDSPDKDKAVLGFARRLAVPFGLAAALIAAGLLYATRTPGGKEGTEGAASTGDCYGSAEKTARLQGLVHGEIAALNLVKQPKPLPILKFAAPDGAPIGLAAFRGKVVLFNLWATWCVPCRKEMPALDRLQGLVGDDAFAVAAVNIDTSRLEKPKAFLTEIGVKNLGYYADRSGDLFQALKQAGKVIGLPTTILIDGNGCELGTMAGPAQWDSEEAIALLKAAKT
ncbi:thiol:disulfide interchange protein TlpA [Methylocapsa palsarum]|uniref:Thiol-disulfide isomerase or thioredoxin n=1 Tax=Methylocapsa palsarum TaxID=1612308 RepID=A0A1I3WGA6_9HYPH|nr:TlpA disulfide reductase family protein [Methylocapsa palsarum]SFK05486.1 Thiol-disulfide isomerase or thioredoxin [Methylocapsa palsarum]